MSDLEIRYGKKNVFITAKHVAMSSQDALDAVNCVEETPVEVTQ